MNKIFLILLSFNYLTLHSQSNNILVEKIYKELTVKNLSYVELVDSINVIQKTQKKGNKKADFLLLEISKLINLKFKKFTYNNPNSLFSFRDSIFLFNSKYCIDNLFYEKKVLKYEQPLRLNFASAYTFLVKSKKYISLFFWDSTLPTSNPEFYVILFDISDRKNIKPYFFEEQMSFNPNCFGDFNNDGYLDFANWSYGKKIYCMTLVGNKFKKVKNKFLVIEENSNRVFSINWTKSKWNRNN